MFQNLSTLRYPTFKLAIVGLLTLNVFIYSFTDTATKALDALVWLVLLILYELETNKVATPVDHWLPKLRSSLIVLIVWVFISYFNSKEWLDVINSILWFILIALLEIEVRWPGHVRRQPKAYWLATVTVFSGLLAMVMAWLWKSAWLDAYDAVLWIVAFGAIEVDIFQVLQPKKNQQLTDQ